MDLSPARRPPLALLVDGENLPRDMAKRVLETASNHGTPQVRRVYGNLNAISGWEDHGFRLCPTRPGKNAADMLLCVEAMMLALRDGFDTIAIASSDRDFSYLAEQLRELGKQVIGLGTSKAPASFRWACTQFVTVALPAPAPAAPVSKPPKGIEAIVVEAVGKDGLEVFRLGQAAVTNGFKVSGTPEKTWRKWLEARGTLFVLDPKGPNARVRLRA
jgi:hypothetical protein